MRLHPFGIRNRYYTKRELPLTVQPARRNVGSEVAEAGRLQVGPTSKLGSHLNIGEEEQKIYM